MGDAKDKKSKLKNVWAECTGEDSTSNLCVGGVYKVVEDSEELVEFLNVIGGDGAVVRHPKHLCKRVDPPYIKSKCDSELQGKKVNQPWGSWAECVARSDDPGFPIGGGLIVGKVYEVAAELVGSLNIIRGDGTISCHKKLLFKRSDGPTARKMVEDDLPDHMHYEDEVPDFCYNVTDKAIKFNRCKFVKTKTLDGESSWIETAHGGTIEFKNAYDSLDKAKIVAEYKWGLK